jgi:hypothetical protein
MLQRLDDHVRACIDRAVEAHERAAWTNDLKLKEQHLEIAARWRHLARSYEFVGRLESFLLSSRTMRDPLPEPPEE